MPAGCAAVVADLSLLRQRQCRSEAARRIQEKLKTENRAKLLVPTHKDWNEELFAWGESSQMNGIQILLLATGIMVSVLIGITLLAQNYSLNGIKSKTVGDGQHGTARWATRAEIRRTYRRIPLYAPAVAGVGRDGMPTDLPQGIVVGCLGKGKKTTALWTPGTSMCLCDRRGGCGQDGLLAVSLS